MDRNSHNMQELLEPAPIEPLKGKKLHLDKIIDSVEGLKIYLAESLDEKKRIVLSFTLNEIVGYSVTNDSYTWKRTKERKCEPGHSIYIVSNSREILKFQEETYSTTCFEEAEHYCIILDEEEIDIVTFTPPQVSYIYN